MRDVVLHGGFVLSTVPTLDGFVTKLRRKDGGPFVVGRVAVRECFTRQFPHWTSALEDAMLIADDVAAAPESNASMR